MPPLKPLRPTPGGARTGPSLVRQDPFAKPVPRNLGSGTTAPTRGPEQLEPIAGVIARVAVQERKLERERALSPLRAPAAAAPISLTSVDVSPGPPMITPELPVRRLAPRRMGHATAQAISRGRVQSLAERAASASRPTTPERPAHDYLARTGAATNPREAALNRARRKSSAVRRGLQGPRVQLGAGVNPADLANGLQTPGRGMWRINGRRFKPGTPEAITTAPVDELPISLTPAATSGSPESAAPGAAGIPALALPMVGPESISTAGSGAEQAPEGSLAAEAKSGGGLGRVLFLGGALWLAWMLFGRGGR